MATRPDALPEGTDSIIGGASDDGTAEQIDTGAADFGGTTSRLREEAAGFTSQAAAKARDYAAQGKDRATDALDGLSRAVSEVAATVDERVGPQYGDYARRAADAVASFSADLRSKELDELYQDAQRMVRSSPAIAIGTAAAVGFALVRLMKSGAAALAEEEAAAPVSTSEKNGEGTKLGGKTSTKKNKSA